MRDNFQNMEKCKLCQSKKDLKSIQNSKYLEAVEFLKGQKNEGQTFLCSPCFSKVQMVSGFKQETQEENIEEEDLDLEELDHLSSFYAEQEFDPDFEPRSSKKKVKVKKAASKKVQLKCQICDASFSRVIALR